MIQQTLNPVYLLVATLVMALLPLLIGLFTSYLKISIVFGMLRSGLGAGQVPGQLVIMAMSLALTAVTMGTVFDETAQRLLTPEVEGLLKQPSLEGIRKAGAIFEPWIEFLTKHSGQRELAVFAALSASAPGSPDPLISQKGQQIPLRAVLPAFIFTEIKESFAMAFVLLLPFLVIDLIVANVLAGMGMFMVSPAMVALPLKLLLFVSADGWLLLAQSLAGSYVLTG